MKSTKSPMAVVLGFLTLFGIGFASVAITGWLLMLLAGALWHEFGWVAPVGFWPATGIAFLGGLVSSIFRMRVTRSA